MYITLVRSTLEYAASIWDPHLAQDCDLLLEKLQQRSARFVKGDYRTTSSVSQMLHDLGWCDLKHRRQDLILALLYKRELSLPGAKVLSGNFRSEERKYRGAKSP